MALLMPGRSEKCTIIKGMKETFQIRQNDRKNQMPISHMLKKFPHLTSYDGEIVSKSSLLLCCFCVFNLNCHKLSQICNILILICLCQLQEEYKLLQPSAHDLCKNFQKHMPGLLALPSCNTTVPFEDGKS